MSPAEQRAFAARLKSERNTSCVIQRNTNAAPKTEVLEAQAEVPKIAGKADRYRLGQAAYMREYRAKKRAA